MGKRAFPPLPTRPQLVLAVYPALFHFSLVGWEFNLAKWGAWADYIWKIPIQHFFTFNLMLACLFDKFKLNRMKIIEKIQFFRSQLAGWEAGWVGWAS